MSALNSSFNYPSGDVAGVNAARQSGNVPLSRKHKRSEKFDYRCQVLCVPDVPQHEQCCASVCSNPVRS